MELVKCKDLFDSVIMDFTDENPITALCTLITNSGEELNSELAKIFTDESQSLALDYLLNRYDKTMSPLFMRLYNKYEEDLEDTCQAVASIIKMKFLFNWNKLAEAVFSDYNPIDNYNMTENKKTDYKEETVTDNTDKTTQRYTGFNSNDMQDVSESKSEGNINTTKTDTGTSANNELTRRGNIGVTTTQQMIQSSYELAKKNVLDIIYSNIDNVLFIDYYC